MPTKAELREASLVNDCASARLFMRQVDVFIKYVLGVDPATKKPTPHRGLFDTVQTYFGMAETQGRGTLRIHFLIWLKDCPPNSAAVEKHCEALRGINFVTPCRLRASLVALPVPETAYKDPQTGMHSAKLRKTTMEPVFLQ
ncbi:hypothetical protein PC129_g15793 [Phytophthora cactorum]|uniref:Helitron helicase-like domain-containing protein n=1 Tax=Phytophthora cactorum TaxID=29920 RepID=A0A8T0YPI7_9STRA|nr:hypothetical protein PC111_g17074 [Phytophthora cactorum]KAG2846329.1 hypothetical protein PC113_g17991 [Phytophthora cactorum]KAG2998898.1 hypothetical protein PC119_g17329 [Phytophthora cactorum]KAG3157492.1 hypothetical protein C6341_g14716 [Phytophthora cactorum]KAG3213267.1 hypothetical protein PC129_g15793 [Phytophthora cactorum]